MYLDNLPDDEGALGKTYSKAVSHREVYMKLMPILIATLIAIMTFSGCGGSGGGNTVLPPAYLNLPSAPYCLDLGPYVDGSNPEDGALPTPAQVAKLLDVLRPYTQAVRTYTCAPLQGSADTISSIAKQKKFIVSAGAWISTNQTANKKEADYLIAEMDKKNADLAILGSEVFLRKDLTHEEMLTWIRYVKARNSTVPLTVDDSWYEIYSAPEVVAELDKVMINNYPCWEGKNIDEAFAVFVDHYNVLKAKYPDKEIIIGETGWAFAGDTYQNAEFTPANALKYLEKILMWSKLNNVKVYYFEAFDEPWKTRSVPVGPNWGLWTKDLQLKPGVLDIFKKTPVADPDTAPSLSISDASFTEKNVNNTVNVTVSLSSVSTKPVSVKYATSGSTATSPSDFTANSGTLNFPAGTKSANIQVEIVGDTLVENDETFKISLSEPVNATLGNMVAIITIQNDDAVVVEPPTISISDSSTLEGNVNKTIKVPVTLSKAFDKVVSVKYSTSNLTAIAGEDYAVASGTLSFPLGQVSQDISIEIKGDTAVESDESFKINLSDPVNGTLLTTAANIIIQNDDIPPVLPKLSIQDLSVLEGSYTASQTLTVSLDKASDKTITVDYATANASAVATDDYIAKSGTLSFPAGSTSQNIYILTVGDLMLEPDEAFKVVLSNPTNATISSGTSTITVTNDDQALGMVSKSCPKIGQFTDWSGQCYGIKPSDYKVAVYIKVYGWWTKPTWDEPTTYIFSDGTWSCDITTGGFDETATDVAAFLIPATYAPPLAEGGDLPQAVVNAAVRSIQIDRTKM
jgi:exo-beta-1,3-glucanase (GH17 family)